MTPEPDCPLTDRLQAAIDRVARLTASEQDAVAAMILDELDADRRWDDAFARSQDGLARLADEARRDIAGGRVRAGGIDDL